jgi:hypothetical protein
MVLSAGQIALKASLISRTKLRLRKIESIKIILKSLYFKSTAIDFDKKLSIGREKLLNIFPIFFFSVSPGQIKVVVF